MGRSPCCSKEGLNRGAWTKQEDFILSEYIRIHGEGGWRNLPLKAGLERCGKSCRLRWLNYLRPDIKRGRISPDEEDLIIRLHRLLGNRWSLIAGRLPGRTDNEIKNYWNTHLSKQLPSMKESNPNSTKKLKTRSKSPPLRNPVFKTTPMKITRAVSYPEMVRPNNSHGYGCRNPSSDEAFKLCNANKNANDSKSWCNLLVNDEFTEDDSERLAFAAANNLVGITEATNSTRFMSSLANERSPNSYKFGADAATLADSLLDFNDLSSPDCSIDFESEELTRGPSTFAAEASEFEVICPDRNLRRVNSFTVPHDQEIEEFYDNAHHTEWLNELDYLKNSSSVSDIATVGIR